MRVVLLGGLTAVLGALVAAGGFIIQRPRVRATEPVADEPQEPPARGPVRRPTTLRALPSIPVGSCVAPSGQACWRGRVTVSADVRAAWERERQAQDLPDDAEDSDRTPSIRAEADVHDEGGERRRTPARRFHVVATRLADAPSGADDDPLTMDDEEDDDPIDVDAAPDGTFELWLRPGRYDVEATSGDDILIGGVDGLLARPGAADEGLTIVAGLAVAVEGRVVDADGLGVGCEVELRKRSQRQVLDLDYSDGPFAFHGLRTGTYQLTVRTDDGAETVVEVTSPAQGVRVRVRPPAVGLVVVARREDGRCPRGTLSYSSTGGAARRVPVRDCHAVLPAVAPERGYRLYGVLEGRRYDQSVTFASSSSGFVCLDPWCGPVDAHLRVRVVDAAGDDATAEVSACPRGDCEEVTLGAGTLEFRQPVGTQVVVHAVGDGALGAATATLWTQPGINQIVLRLPGLNPAIEPDAADVGEVADDESEGSGSGKGTVTGILH